MKEFEGKKLLILGGNAETTPLVEIANQMGIKTIVSSARKTDPAKKAAWKAYHVDGMDISGLIDIAKKENVDGALVGVADILVPSYCELCNILHLPCYATKEIVEALSFKDNFKKLCQQYGIKGIPEYDIKPGFTKEETDKIQFPVMVKPVDNGGGVGMTLCYSAEELPAAMERALNASKQKRFIVERFMDCEDVGIYYTFKDGICSASCVFDRHTSNSQPGLSKVNLGSTYPSIHIKEYFEKFHEKFLRVFKEIGIQNGVLAICGFYEDGELYVYDPGFRLQGEAMHLLMKEVNGFDQREMLIRFALTGSQGSIDLLKEDDAYFRGKYAATLWILLKAGEIRKITGLEEVIRHKNVKYNVQRLYEGDIVSKESVGTERQVLTRIYIVSETSRELADDIKYCIDKVKVIDANGDNMIIKFDELEEFVRTVLYGNYDQR